MAKRIISLSKGQDGESDTLTYIHTYRKMKLVREFPVTALPLFNISKYTYRDTPEC